LLIDCAKASKSNALADLGTSNKEGDDEGFPTVSDIGEEAADREEADEVDADKGFPNVFDLKEEANTGDIAASVASSNYTSISTPTSPTKRT